LTPLEQALPVCHFSERHSRWIDAPPERVWAALEALTLDELPITRGLVAIRHLGADRENNRSRRLFTDGPVQMLNVSGPWYAVGGTIARPWQHHPQQHPVTSLAQFAAFTAPGWVKYLTDFHLQAQHGGVQLTTATRGRGTDWTARARFAPYWALIRPASGLIRNEMLAAVARTAQTDTHAPPAAW
jgi:hypothetical protein